MKHFTIYDKKTGAVLRSGACARDDDVHLQAKRGEGVLLDVRGCTISQVVNLTTKRLNKKPAHHVERYHREHADHCARAEALAGSHVSSAVLIELLKAKGIEITAADFMQANAAVRTNAGVMQQGTR